MSIACCFAVCGFPANVTLQQLMRLSLLLSLFLFSRCNCLTSTIVDSLNCLDDTIQDDIISRYYYNSNITFVIKFDSSPSQTSWQISKQESNDSLTTILTGDGTSSSQYQTISQSITVSDDIFDICYNLEIWDSYGDGMSSIGNYGWFTLTFNDFPITLGKQTFGEDYVNVYFCTETFDSTPSKQNQSNAFEITWYDYNSMITIIDDINNNTLLYENSFEFPDFITSNVTSVLYLNDGCYDITFKHNYATSSNGINEITWRNETTIKAATDYDDYQLGDACVRTKNNLTFVVRFDGYPEETSWMMRNHDMGFVMLSGNGRDYSAYDTVTESIWVNDGCYNFTIFDSHSDGLWSIGDYGWFKLYLNDGFITLDKQTIFTDESMAQLYFCTQLFDDINIQNNEVSITTTNYHNDIRITKSCNTSDVYYFNTYWNLWFHENTTINETFYLNDGCYNFEFSTNVLLDWYIGNATYNLSINGQTLISVTLLDAGTNYTIIENICLIKGNNIFINNGTTITSKPTELPTVPSQSPTAQPTANPTLNPTQIPTAQPSEVFYFSVADNGKFAQTETFGCDQPGCSVIQQWVIDGDCNDPRLKISVVETDYSSSHEQVLIYINDGFMGNCEILTEDRTYDWISCALSGVINSSDVVSFINDNSTNGYNLTQLGVNLTDSGGIFTIELGITDSVDCCGYVATDGNYYLLYGEIAVSCEIYPNFTTSMPTQSPSNDPTIIPTSNPTTIPTDNPSLLPTITPSSRPTAAPNAVNYIWDIGEDDSSTFMTHFGCKYVDDREGCTITKRLLISGVCVNPWLQIEYANSELFGIRVTMNNDSYYKNCFAEDDSWTICEWSLEEYFVDPIESINNIIKLEIEAVVGQTQNSLTDYYYTAPNGKRYKLYLILTLGCDSSYTFNVGSRSNDIDNHGIDVYTASEEFGCNHNGGSSFGCSVVKTWDIYGKCNNPTLSIAINEYAYNYISSGSNYTFVSLPETVNLYINEDYWGVCKPLGYSFNSITNVSTCTDAQEYVKSIDNSSINEWFNCTFGNSSDTDIDISEYVHLPDSTSWQSLAVTLSANMDGDSSINDELNHCSGTDSYNLFIWSEVEIKCNDISNTLSRCNDTASEEVEFVIKLDDWPEETSWMIYDADGNMSTSSIDDIDYDYVVFYDNGTNYDIYDKTSQNGCLQTSHCYYLIVNDSYGDGMDNSGDWGWFELFVNHKSVTFGKQGVYLHGSSIYFCTQLFQRENTGDSDTYTSNSSLIEFDFSLITQHAYTFDAYDFTYYGSGNPITLALYTRTQVGDGENVYVNEYVVADYTQKIRNIYFEEIDFISENTITMILDNSTYYAIQGSEYFALIKYDNQTNNTIVYPTNISSSSDGDGGNYLFSITDSSLDPGPSTKDSKSITNTLSSYGNLITVGAFILGLLVLLLIAVLLCCCCKKRKNKKISASKSNETKVDSNANDADDRKQSPDPSQSPNDKVEQTGSSVQGKNGEPNQQSNDTQQNVEMQTIEQ